MILKGNMLKLTIPFFWAVQSIWLLSFKSIETFIAAIILLLISFLGIAYDIYIGPYYEFYSFGIYVKEVWTKVTK